MIGSKKVTAVIPAAGLGKRMGKSIPEGFGKQFISIRNKPLLSYTIEKFIESKYVDEIIIVSAPAFFDYLKNEIVDPFQCPKPLKIVFGGKERQDSVYEGFKAIDNSDIVLIHDGVRPFIKSERIDQLIEVCNQTKAAILGVRPKDTVKLQDAGEYVRETLDRSVLWNIQTPQAFDYHILQEAFESAQGSGFYGTDESMLVEKIGHKIKIVQGDYDNIKITTPDDLVLAELILGQY